MTNYDPIAALYQLSKQQPWRTHIEAFTFLGLIGDPTGKAVLDVACGEGFYTRMMRQRGAAKVMGVDLSAGMVELARKQETEHQLGIDYQIGDARNLAFTAEYDLVIAAYLLNYARDRSELRAMCNGIARCLKPGGRFVTVNTNPATHFPSVPSYRKYGFEASTGGEWREGTPIQWKFYLEDRTFEIENYHLNLAAHEEALKAAGFQNIRWHGPQLSPEGQKAYGAEFWSLLLTECPVAFLECSV
ncbi:MAG: class I SAM-dependent methyltransferase [Planctomycetaceae bacterium]|nr:class I SAM-dependent methyltransferase [Planctomycetaceae bacterium]